MPLKCGICYCMEQELIAALLGCNGQRRWIDCLPWCKAETFNHNTDQKSWRTDNKIELELWLSRIYRPARYAFGFLFCAKCISRQPCHLEYQRYFEGEADKTYYPGWSKSSVTDKSFLLESNLARHVCNWRINKRRFNYPTIWHQFSFWPNSSKWRQKLSEPCWCNSLYEMQRRYHRSKLQENETLTVVR